MQPRPVWVLLLFFILIVEAYKDGLYSTEDDDVLPLNGTALVKRVVKNEENIIWVVEFYNSWCGHCIQFAPTWKKLAASLKGWRDLVRIAALDCSQSINLNACRKFEVDRYPTMKLFSTRSKENSQTMKPLKSQDMNVIFHIILNFMTEFTPPSSPRLAPLKKIEDIWQEKTDKHEYVALIFEEAESIVGRKVVIDMRNTPNVLVRTMLKESVVKYGLNNFPSLYQINPDSTYSLLSTGTKLVTEDHEMFVRMLQLLSKGEGYKINLAKPKKDSAVRIDPAADSNKRQEELDTPEKNNSLRVSMQDLESALHYTFRQEIAICKNIGGDKFHALKKFVQVLLKYFPGRQPIMKFLQAVNQMLSQLPFNVLSGEEWIDKIDKLQSSDAFLPDVIEWDCCQGSQPRYRGYPCAMWVLFHTLTVGAYDQQTLGGSRAQNPLEVPLAIRGYMHHFFGCEECAKHFVEMANTMEQDIKDTKSAVLWFWTSHNKVNLRLKGDESEDKAFPKIQFPPASLCSTCHSGKSNADNMPTWNMEAVLKFLLYYFSGKYIYISPDLSKREYLNDGKVTVAQAKSKSGSRSRDELDWWEKKQKEQDLKTVRLLRARKKEKMAQKRQDSEGVINVRDGVIERMRKPDVEAFEAQNFRPISGIFSDVDLSMCVIFYIISTVIILGLYHHFIIRKSTMPCNIRCPR